MTIHPDILMPAKRVAVLVPPANPTVEPEMRFLLPERIGIHFARFPVMPNTDLDTRNRAYLDHYDPTLKAFGSIRMNAGLIGLTGPSYRLLPQGDLDQCAVLSSGAGYPVATASVAIAAALRRLGAKKVALVSPYPAWLTEKAAAYWRAGGLEITQVVEISEEFRAYELTTNEVAAALEHVDASRCDAIVMSGTGMLTVPAIRLAVSKVKLPMLSSNLCSAWWLLDTLSEVAGERLSECAPTLADLLAQSV